MDNINEVRIPGEFNQRMNIVNHFEQAVQVPSWPQTIVGYNDVQDSQQQAHAKDMLHASITFPTSRTSAQSPQTV